MVSTRSSVALAALGVALLLSPAHPTLGAQGTPATPPAASKPVAGAQGFGPNGATLRCRDGSYPAAGAPDSACDGKGGVLVRYPSRPVRPAKAVAAPAAGSAAAARTEPTATPAPADFVPFSEVQARVEGDKARRARPPEGATLLCQDGSYVVADTASIRCQQKGGVRARFTPQPRPNGQ